DAADGRNDGVKRPAFFCQPLASGRRELIDPYLAIGIRESPFGIHPVIDQQPLESRVERSLADLQSVLGQCLDMLRDAIAVVCATRERLQDEHFERAWEKFASFH